MSDNNQHVAGKAAVASGVTPDKIVTPTIDDLVAGRDTGLKEAEHFLQNLLKSAK